MKTTGLLAIALCAGATIAYVDSRPTWDDAGVTAFALLASAAILGIVGPERPWLWALAIGLWTPAHALMTHPVVSSLLMLIVLVFPLAGAYAGVLCRRLVRVS